MKFTKTLTPFAALLGLALFLPACGSTSPSDSGSGNLEIADITVGTGATAVAGDFLTVHYTGSLTNGSVFETSVGRAPYSFRLGAGTVIAGWDQGIVGMRVGGKRRLTIPPSLAYGAQGSGQIPGNATIRFDVELLSIAGK
ncbi:MAG: FKBP-type peptidyl-prolyl cis-trans isomerase [Vicinamibacteria bacterium]|nr:FKBP-type peptidyl-prolyl cis-trans isomerase [Vicinamibacteria bacterium]